MKLENKIWGSILLVVGIILFLNVLGFSNINIFFDGWWTFFIIIPCLIGLINEPSRKGYLIGLIIGIILFLCCQGIISFIMILKLIIPTILIVIGVSLLTKKDDKKSKKNKNKDK